jgi:tetratricopeptide (TPR) repeat protein
VALAFSIAATGVNAQSGYWDKERATTRQIIVPAGDRISVKTENFPLGTTEIVYRITVLDENQQMANSLVSLLKSIPDPSGISQGSAGAIFLLSKISGDDKCQYAIFSDKDKADAYKSTGKPENACLYQNNPIDKEAKLISGKSACLNTESLWFGFESKNWLMKQKIVLEVVPWVDNKASTGWTNDNKKSVLELCKTSTLAGLMINKDDLCLCILDKFTQKYTFAEYQNLLVNEKSKAFRDFGNACLDAKTADKTLLSTIRGDALQHFTNGHYDKAIELLNTAIVANGNATAKDYYALGNDYLFSKQFTKAIQSFRQGEKLDDSDLGLKLGLAHAYLLSGDFSSAKEIHKKYMSENIDAAQDWISHTKNDFTEFKKAGIDSKDFDRILKLFP